MQKRRSFAQYLNQLQRFPTQTVQQHTNSSMKNTLTAVLASTLTIPTLAQIPGHQKPLAYPQLKTSECTKAGGCTSTTTNVVIDSNWMWTHKKGTYTNCFSGNAWDPTLCPDGKTCAANCALDAGDVNDYANTYGVRATDDALSLNFVTKTQYGTNVGSRTFLMKDATTYKMFKLKNREFTFTVDDSTMPCGINGALYFSAMQEDGGLSEYPGNTAGAAYGTGYCDAQCPHDIKFINGEANVEGWNPSPADPNAGSGKYGTCCTELDIWEANMDATQLTPHVCRDPAGTQYRCQGDSCGDDASNERYDGLCDKDGGDWNPYRLGQTNFWGPGSQYTVDSTKPVTVVTQFITHDGTDTGDLSEIKRFYIQNGKQINSTAWNGYDSITDDYITAAKTKFNDTKSFEPRGGMKRLGDVMESNGMVLVMSIWDDHAVNMVWLDATDPPGGTALGDKRGRCSEQSGVPATLEKEHPNSKVIFSDIRSGEIGSTTGNTPGPSPAPSGCPGGSLSACMALCPSTPPAAYKACVQDCVNRCP